MAQQHDVERVADGGEHHGNRAQKHIAVEAGAAHLAADDQQHAGKAARQRHGDAPVEPLAQHGDAEERGERRRDEAQRDGIGERQARQREEERDGGDDDENRAQAVVERGLPRRPAGRAPGRIDAAPTRPKT